MGCFTPSLQGSAVALEASALAGAARISRAEARGDPLSHVSCQELEAIGGQGTAWPLPLPSCLMEVPVRILPGKGM